jgi:hypothetical protein
MASENSEIQKRRGFNGLAGISWSVEKQRNSSEFGGAATDRASASFDRKRVGRERRERRKLQAPLTAVHAPRPAGTRPVKIPATGY